MTLDEKCVPCQDAEAPETIDGIRVKRSGKRAKGGAGAPARPRVEKTVVNCLACGKVYDCRPVTNDIIMFLGEHSVPKHFDLTHAADGFVNRAGSVPGCACPPAHGDLHGAKRRAHV